MKKIKLSQGQATIVDDEDFKFFNQWQWYAHKERNTFYACRKEAKLNFAVIRMHRVLMGNPVGLVVDHINGDGLDNRKENLRICTIAENLCNRGKQKNNTSGFKGVSWASWAGMWRVKIGSKGKGLHVGYFQDSKDAAIAYQMAEKKIHGDFSFNQSI